MSSTYPQVKAWRQKQRQLKLIAEMTARIGRLALQIHELDEAAGRPVGTEVSAVVRAAFRIMKQTHKPEEN
jgi:hypothetical protein